MHPTTDQPTCRPIEERRRALRFLVHQVEDLYQPHHVGDNPDRGAIGTQV
jgi:hypothetical protein